MNIASAIAWLQDRQGRVTYSMINRNGPSSYDCSSAVYYSLIQGGFLPAGHRIGNTDSLYGDLEKNGWVRVPEVNGSIDAQYGDIFLWGIRGQSSGGAGHTGWFLNPNDIIHCAYGYNGVAVSNHDWLSRINGSPALTVYRFTGKAPAPAPVNPVDQVLAVGSVVKFPKTYRVDEVANIGGIWQVRTTELCRFGFNWDDNGVPTEPLVEVDIEGYRTTDQELETGALYVLPGSHRVLDIGQGNNGEWLAQFDIAGVKFWVDVDTLIEISGNDLGQGTPAVKPVVVGPKDPVIVTPPNQPAEPVVETPAEPTTPVTPTTPTEPEQPTEPENPTQPTTPNNNSEAIERIREILKLLLKFFKDLLGGIIKK